MSVICPALAALGLVSVFGHTTSVFEGWVAMCRLSILPEAVRFHDPETHVPAGIAKVKSCGPSNKVLLLKGDGLELIVGNSFHSLVAYAPIKSSSPLPTSNRSRFLRLRHSPVSCRRC